MSLGGIAAMILGVLAPVSLVFACVCEALAARGAKNPRGDKQKLAKTYTAANAGLVAAWLLLAAAYLVFKFLSGASDAQTAQFQTFMTWALLAALAADIVFLALRRGRPAEFRGRRQFWEKK